MNTNLINRLLCAAVLAVGIVALGLCIRSGFNKMANKDRKVTVKGLAEMEVAADKVTWPIVSKEIGNNLPELYDKIAVKQDKIKKFLLDNGIKEDEILVNAPEVKDLEATDYYGSNERKYRYNITSILTVTSRNVDLVRNIIAQQGELLKEGIAIVEGGWDNPVSYEFVSFNDKKQPLMKEAIENAEKTAEQFADNSKSKLGKIVYADQGQFSIDDRDGNTPYIKKIRVVTTITYSLKD